MKKKKREPIDLQPLKSRNKLLFPRHFTFTSDLSIDEVVERLQQIEGSIYKQGYSQIIRLLEFDQYDDAVEFAVHTQLSSTISYDRVRGLIFSDVDGTTMIVGFARFRAFTFYLFTFLLLFMGCAALIPDLHDGTPSLTMLFIFVIGLYFLSMWPMFKERNSLIHAIGAALKGRKQE